MEVKRCLIVDTETTGLDHTKDDIIEVGAILFSVENVAPLASVSLIFPGECINPVASLNKISEPMLREVEDFDQMRKYFGDFLESLISAADVFVAHRASFDKGFLTVGGGLFLSKPWTCSKEEFLFREGKPGDSLVNIALAHGVPVYKNHRALTDCELLSAIFQTYSSEALSAMFTHAMLPRDHYVAVTGYAEREKPKAAGFSWMPEKKMWWKKLTLEEAAKISEFQIRKVQPEVLGLA